MITGLPTPFCTVQFADGINADSAAWGDATNTSKENSLQFARLYIENNYLLYFSVTNVPETVQTANAMLAEKNLTADLFNAQSLLKPQAGLTEKTVDAKGVKSSKKWDPAFTGKWIDPYPQITAILLSGGYCKLKNGGGMITVPLVRR
jgi:hypothetical protein